MLCHTKENSYPFSELIQTLARRGWCCQSSRRTGSGHQWTRPGTGTVAARPSMWGDNLRAQFLNGLLACQIPDLDGWTVGNAQPVTVGREAQGIDDVIVLKSVQVLAVIEIPQQSLGVLATGSAQRTIGRDGHGVKITVVAMMIVLQLAVSQIPDLNGAIPAA